MLSSGETRTVHLSEVGADAHDLTPAVGLPGSGRPSFNRIGSTQCAPQISQAAWLSAVLPLLPGDVIYTGTPAGVGLGRTPQRWLAPGDELVSTIEGIGELRQRFVG
jgi:Fumarylacetoacetate (FAA) hydrolase family